MDIRINGNIVQKRYRPKIKKYCVRIVITIMITIIGLLTVMPMVFTVANSLAGQWEIDQNYNTGQTDATDLKGNGSSQIRFRLLPEEATLMQYYTVLIKKTQFIFMFFNSLKLVLPIVIGQVCIASLAAYGFSVFEFKWKEPIFYAYIVVMLMPFQVTLVPNYIVADKLGIIGSYLSIILPGIFSPFGVFLMRQYMSSIPGAYAEAAKIDGANLWQVFLKVYAPVSKGGMAALFILSFIDNWNMVEQPLIFINDSIKQPLSIYLATINKGEAAIAFAASVIYMVPMLLIFLYGEEYLYEGIQHSGIKG